MFEGPEYEPYISLCRKLNLQRGAEAGDWFLSLDLTNPEEASIVLCNSDSGGCGETFNDGSWAKIWLPRLDQWLTMLKEADPEYSWHIVIEHREDGFYACRYINDWARGVTREEAVARLYTAICWPDGH